MIGGLGAGELVFGSVAPLVGLGTLVLDDVGGVAVVEEGGDVLGQVLDGEAVDHAVAVASPGVGGSGCGEKSDETGGDGEAGDRAKRAHYAEYMVAMRQPC